MIKTISVNISGMAFTINEDAYKRLQDYLQSVEQAYNNDKETVSGIESRVAELFYEYLNKLGRQVVEMSDVEMVIEQIGNPGQMNGDATSTTEKPKAKTKLYRDKLNGFIGGVSSGLAEYTGMDVAIVRLLWVLLFLIGNGITALVYLLFWLIVPEAKTPVQRLEMKGLAQTPENIQKETATVINTNPNSGCLSFLAKALIVLSVAFLLFPLLFVLFILLAVFGIVGAGISVPAFAGLNGTLAALSLLAILICPIAALIYLGVSLHKRNKGENPCNKQKLAVYLTLLALFIAGISYLGCNADQIEQNFEDMGNTFEMMIDKNFDPDDIFILDGDSTFIEYDINAMP